MGIYEVYLDMYRYNGDQARCIEIEINDKNHSYWLFVRGWSKSNGDEYNTNIEIYQIHIFLYTSYIRLNEWP